MRQDSNRARLTCGMNLNRGHFAALVDRMLSRYANQSTLSFSFATSSRAAGWCTERLTANLQDILAIMPSESWCFLLLCPLLASAIVLACYPPGCHSEFTGTFV
jgi:hypothetical protein